MKISIFSPTHNTIFLREAYDSIKGQNFYEWIVVFNNGAEVIDFDDPRVKPFVLTCAPKWVGPLKAFACEQATGDVLLELDHDDLLTPNAVAEVRKAFRDPEIGFVYSNTIHATGDFQKVNRFSEVYGWKYREVKFNGHDLDEHISFPPSPDCISRIWFAPNHLRAFRKSVYDQVRGYNKEMRILDDLDLMCRMYLVTKFKHIDKGLYVYRVHGENSWLRYNAEIQENVYRIYDQYIDQLVMRLNGEKIDLGGRKNAAIGYKTVDLKDANILADLNSEWPFKDDSFAVIRACDVFEHLKDPLHTIKECYRVLKPGGWLMGQVPSTDGRGAFQDPTHVSFWNENSFLYYTHRDWAQYIDTPVRFQTPRIYTTEKNEMGVNWVKFNLISLKDGYRPPGMVDI